MPSLRMLPDTVTIFNYIGEVDDVAVYQDTIIDRCYYPQSLGVTADTTGKRADDSSKLYIFDHGSRARSADGVARTYLPYPIWKSLDESDKKFHWTIGNSGKDYVLKEGHEEKLYFQSFSHLTNGSKRMWHFEVRFK